MQVEIKILFEFVHECVLEIRTINHSKTLFFQAQRPEDYRTFYQTRPLLELNLEFAKWLSRAPENTETLKDAERLFLIVRQDC